MIRIVTHRHNYDLERFSDLRLMLIQEKYPENYLDKRSGDTLFTGITSGEEGEKLRPDIINILATIQGDRNIIVISEHTGNLASFDLFQEQADKHGQIIIPRLGYYKETDGKEYNSAAVFLPNERNPVMIHQTSLSVQDKKRGCSCGDKLNIFELPFGKMGVINCHDYTNPNIISALLHEEIDLLVVPTFNPASTLYRQYAMSDMHRLFCFIVVSNISNYGGSGVFAPFRDNDDKNYPVEYQGSLVSVQGNSIAYIKPDLHIDKLRKAKNILRNPIINLEEKRSCLDELRIIMPGESFFSQNSPYRETIKKENAIESVDLAGIGFRPNMNDAKIYIGIAHLRGLGDDDYKVCRYHLSDLDKNTIGKYKSYILNNLDYLKSELKNSDKKLDFLVFPEVFIPECIDTELRNFALEYNTVIICGMEYTRSSAEKLPHNGCKIYIPLTDGKIAVYEYVKLTKSKYDAMMPNGSPNKYFKLEYGTNLIKFIHKDFCNFSPLICYDYSHFDIIHTLNLSESLTDDPIDLLFVMAYNPNSKLYESCCISDCHRFYQYIAMCNVAQYGGSGVFGPVKKPGAEKTLLFSGENVDGIHCVEIDVNSIKKARKLYDEDIDRKNKEIGDNKSGEIKYSKKPASRKVSISESFNIGGNSI